MRKSYLLDTGIAQDYQAKRGNVRDRSIELRKQGHRIGICTPVLGELWSGVECSSSRQKNLLLLKQAVSTLLLWPYTAEASEEYGKIFAELRQIGRIVQQIDMQIAAIARTLTNCVVVTKDSDFNAISGIEVENWE